MGKHQSIDYLTKKTIIQNNQILNFINRVKQYDEKSPIKQ